MAAEALDVVCIDTTAGFLDSGGFYQKAMITTGEIEPRGVWDMVRKVKARVGTNKIRTLTIHGHGAPGAQGVAFSHDLDRTGTTYLCLDAAGNLAGDGPSLADLGLFFLPNARIYLGGCNVAKGDAGAKLLKAVSQAAGAWGNTVLTFASESWQNPWMPGYEGIDGGLVRYSDGDHVLYTNYSDMD